MFFPISFGIGAEFGYWEFVMAPVPSPVTFRSPCVEEQNDGGITPWFHTVQNRCIIEQGAEGDHRRMPDVMCLLGQQGWKQDPGC